MNAATDRQTCAVCHRGILRGERTYEYATPAGDVRDVCALCRPSAERAGWVPPSSLEVAATARTERRRGWLSGVLFRRPGQHTAGTQAESRQRAASESTVPSPRREVDHDEQPPPAPTAPAKPATAQPPTRDPISAGLTIFNTSDIPRLIAGLNRSLGQPRAAVNQGRGGDTLEVTVAWELSWYTWQVRGEDVSEIAKGAEIADRDAGEPDWNAEVADDGRVAMAGSG